MSGRRIVIRGDDTAEGRYHPVTGNLPATTMPEACIVPPAGCTACCMPAAGGMGDMPPNCPPMVGRTVTDQWWMFGDDLLPACCPPAQQQTCLPACY